MGKKHSRMTVVLDLETIATTDAGGWRGTTGISPDQNRKSLMYPIAYEFHLNLFPSLFLSFSLSSSSRGVYFVGISEHSLVSFRFFGFSCILSWGLNSFSGPLFALIMKPFKATLFWEQQQ